MRRAILPFLLWIPALAACAAAGSRPTASDVEAELREADVALDGATRAHDAQAFARLVCPDAAFGGKSFALGRDEVVSRWAPLIAGEGVGLTWTPQKAGASAAGDLGWTTGLYQFRVEGGAGEEGRYVTVWRREAGRWCASMDTSVEAPEALLAVPREAALRVERSAGGDLVAEAGWLAEQAGTWLEVRRCFAPGDCRTEVASTVAAQKQEP